MTNLLYTKEAGQIHLDFATKLQHKELPTMGDCLSLISSLEEVIIWLILSGKKEETLESTMEGKPIRYKLHPNYLNVEFVRVYCVVKESLRLFWT